MASAAVIAGGIAYSGLGDNAQAGTTTQADAAADTLVPAAAPVRDAEPAAIPDAPANDTARGMVFDGLKAAPKGDKCVGVYRTEAGLCSHGPDAPPKDVDIKVDVAPAVKTKAVAADPARPESGEAAAAAGSGRPQDVPAAGSGRPQDAPAADAATAKGPATDASGGYALTVSNRPYYGDWLLDLQRADGRTSQVWTVQKVG
ncbi:hypothetical protein [Streptomyces sp. KS 21]|uniref:hypothetical protein n=1 Tax=Streptomyces sp. KS 21 TaxID=2485150 RepID=UPI0010625C5E|nr:hypothetical protein [Streptomyces sp. KS 21]